jgi:prepilin peptidase CpaA
MTLSIASIGPLALGALLACAAWQDCASMRIPNRLVGLGLGLGLVLNVMLPVGAGLISAEPGALGLGAAVAGAALGLALMVPLYWIGAMGAGDAKLMAMVGAFGGPAAMLEIAGVSFLFGALVSFSFAARTRSLRLLMGNCGAMLTSFLIGCRMWNFKAMARPAVSVGDVPYAIVIFAGTLMYMLLR